MEVGSTREKDKNKQKSEKPKPPFLIAKDDTKPVLQDPVNFLLFSSNLSKHFFFVFSFSGFCKLEISDKCVFD